MAGLEILCQYRHVAHQQHLARCSLLYEICGTLSELLAVGTARQRLPRAVASARRLEETNGQAAYAVLYSCYGQAYARVPRRYPGPRPRRLRL